MKKFEFFSELNVLNESKIFQSPSNVSKYTYRNILDYTFLYLVIFQILRDEPEFSDFVQKYVRDVLKHGNNFNYYKRTQNDFYHFMHILTGRFNDDVVENLKPSNDKNLLIKNQRIQLNEIISYLNNIRYGRPRQESVENRFFLKLESDFLITNSNFRSVRRLVRDWEDKDYEQRSFVITRILLELRNKLFRSELLKPLEELSKKFRYELPVELKEAKKDSVAGRDFWINPTASEVEKLIQNFGDLRGMIIDERILVWKAYDITHADMLLQLRRYKITDKDFDLLLYFSESKDTQAYEWINNVRPGRRDYVIGYFNGFDFNLKSVSTAAKKQLNKLVEINLHESRIRKIDEKLQHSLDAV